MINNNYEFIILGGGPSGLAFAYSLINLGLPRNKILIIEKETDPGGLCRSKNVMGFPVDLGGGHFLDSRNTKALELIFKFLPEDQWNKFKRIAKINIHDKEIEHPFESNLWQLPQEQQLDYLISIFSSDSNKNDKVPEKFDEYLIWKFGTQIANNYMIPYNRKIWSIPLDELGTYWLEKLPNVNLREILLSNLLRKSFGTLPAHDYFLYPKEFGYGELWLRMGSFLGDSLKLGLNINEIDINNKIVNGKFKANFIVTTIPWTYWSNFSKLPKDIDDSINNLRYSSIDVSYSNTTLNSNAHWIYEPNERIAHHRILLRSNFITDAPGHWTETNSVRNKEFLNNNFNFHNEYAYPINTINKFDSMHKILNWASNHKIYGLGRWGLWEHINSDIAVSRAIELAAKLFKKIQ